ncbi:Triacylglycerol lipase 2 [Nymphaea thermarum]|nr:Triacylglycerol lipase 2 [Nymphaea thermarum]
MALSVRALILAPHLLLLLLLLSVSLVIVNGDGRTRPLMPVRSTIMNSAAEGDAGALPPGSPAGLCLKVGDYGYTCQEYKVTTEDGYILSLNRIPTGGQPVLLQHGVLVDGLTWLVNGMNQSLALVLADAGYDVWIANTRGTRWSRGHISLDPAQREYWEWSWDELVKFDLPDTFDFVYSHTGQKLHYGTLIALASFSQHKLVDKLRSAALLSPIAYLSHMTTPVGQSAANEAVVNILKLVCAKAPGADCYDMMTSFTGRTLLCVCVFFPAAFILFILRKGRITFNFPCFQGKNCCLNSSTVDVFLRNEPQPTSTKNMVHLAQTVRHGTIAMYDYGIHENLAQYGQIEPPIYNMSSVPNDLPLFLSYGAQDALSDSLDVELLLATLGTYVRGDDLVVQFVRDYGHADFVMGTNAKHDVTTGDGYVLTVHRIPASGLLDQQKISSNTNQPVLLQHGILMDGMSWLLAPPEQSLAIILAESGFDKVTHGWYALSFGLQEYWAWSWDQLAQYDLPTVVDLVHGVTRQKLHYVGHSLGTLIALASFSEHKLVEKVRSAALLCPIAYLGHITTVLGQVAAKSFIGEMTGWLGVVEFNPKIEAVENFIKAICRQPGIDCYDLMPAFTGKNCCLNASTVELFLQNEPQPTSTRNFVHLAQMIRGGDVTMYDYGSANENTKHYGQKEPPAYNMSNIPSDLPLFLIYGGQDVLSDIFDLHLLLDSLKFHQKDKLTVHYIHNYAHVDFIMGINAKQLVYDHVVAFFMRQQ